VTFSPLSLLVGVAHCRPIESPVCTKSDRLTPLWALLPGVFREPAPNESPTVVVGHIFASVARFVCSTRPVVALTNLAPRLTN